MTRSTGLIGFLLVLLLGPGCIPDPGDGQADTNMFIPPEAPEHGVQLSIPAFDLAAGAEVERCVTATAPALTGGVVTRMELFARPGLHHTVIYKVNQELEPDEVDCFGIPDDAMEGLVIPEPLFASTSQVTEETLSFPEGVGVPFEAGQQIIFNFHYINVRPEDILGEIYLNLYYAEEAEEIEPARFYAFGNMGSIDIPAGGTQRLTSTCNFPGEMNLFSITPHMHRLGTGFEVSFNDGGTVGDPLLSQLNWDSPSSAYLDPPMPVSPEDGLTFTCEWTNPTDSDVGFGPSYNDEMCFVFGFVYPAPGPVWAFDYNGGCVTEESITTVE